MVQRLLRQSGVTSAESQPWINDELGGLGLADAGLINHPVDLWADIDPELTNLSRWRQHPPGPNQNRQEFFRDVPETLLKLSGFERVSIWGIWP